ncbi:MAG TPA: tripartite tricarboxylate transporter substrate binding protein [Hydrogenophaga sp.]|uniref:Bug family tripartite tricarboxylate transporter substrate binding protein n=1 Tax=Hydrogenophaga sp. TaxID=1904254 RepID=UPI002D1789F9|nr:tripartite tricarboxylate transporter substrate binding protein [Hydrogenophaga sp.]HSX92934.1 tripartite tricarboxylate transporter substrate binding protein [Hydrogenophaga sp.]
MAIPFRALVRRARALALAGLTVGTLSGPAIAQSSEAAYPQGPITLLVPFAPGGSLDATARVLGNKLKDILGQPVVIANRPGAGSAVAARALATAKPDGLTLFITSSSAFGIAHLLVRGHDFQLKDYAPIAGVGVYTSLFAVSDATPAKSLSELVELAAKKPNGLNFCSTGVNGMNHLQLEMLRFAVQKKHPGAKFNITHVPYNGVAPAMLAIKAGDVDACVLPYSALVKNTDGAGLRVIAMQRGTRLPMMPNVGTTGEQGYGELDGNDQVVTISAPAATPRPVLRKLEEAVRAAMDDPLVMKSLNELEVQPRFVDAAGARRWLEGDVRKLADVIQAAGLTGQ